MGLIILVAGPLLFAVIGVVFLLAKTSSQEEMLWECRRRIDSLEAKLHSPAFREALFAENSPLPEPEQAALAEAVPAGSAVPPGGAATAASAPPLSGAATDETAAPPPGGAATDAVMAASLGGMTAAAGRTADNSAAAAKAGTEAGGLTAAPTDADPGQGAEVPAGGAAAGGPALLAGVKGFIRGGNLWAAGGVILLIAGFATLIAWLARRGFFTVEMGIAAAALFGLAMLAAGWRLRKIRRVYFLLLQGGGLGILYLSMFAANRLTPWFSAPVTLALLFLLVLPGVFLALLQEAQVLAFFGFLGGYAAPLLLYQGGGNHLFLFSYYLVLDLGVLVVARFRFWKGLKLLAFLCSFAASLAWLYGSEGLDRQAVFHGEPFFLAYIVLFTFLGLHAIQQRDKRGEAGAGLEWALIFGAPLLGALIQWQVFSYIEHGYAIASIAFSAFYLLLAFIVRRFKIPAILVEGYLGLAALLANLAVPLELSSRLTSAVWAAEGVLVYFLGLRSRRRKVRIAALILHAAASLAFIPEMEAAGFGDSPFRSPRFIGALIIALSALAMVLLAQRLFPRTGGAEGPDRTELPNAAEALGRAEPPGGAEPRDRAEPSNGAEIGAYTLFTGALVLQACAWWFGAWIYECLRASAEPWALFFIVSSLSALLFVLAARRFRCAALMLGALPSLCCALVLCLSGMGQAAWGSGSFSFALVYFNYFQGLYRWAWPVFFILQVPILHFLGRTGGEKIRGPWVFALVLIAAAALSLSGRYFTVRLGLSESWTSFAGLLPFFAILAFIGWFRPRFKPRPLHRAVLFFVLPCIVCGILGIWFLVTLFMPGNPDPLPLYLPILNPLDLEELFCIALFLFWQDSGRRAGDRGSIPKRNALCIADGALFLALIAVIARSNHFYKGIPYAAVPGSEVFQLCLFVLWAVWGIAHIIVGNRIKLRGLWIAGAVLTVADIAKLLVLDLAEAGAAVRIVSFFIAGLILLVIGWIAPLPPSRESAGEGEAP
jgi:uncharacterized membrane protein